MTNLHSTNPTKWNQPSYHTTWRNKF